MLSIYSSDIGKNVKSHAALILEWVKTRIATNLAANNVLKNQMLADISSILSAGPADLIPLSQRYNITFPKVPGVVNGLPGLVTDPRLTNIFNYTAFRSKFGFDFSKILGITCCPYCNRNYTTSHDTTQPGRVTKKIVFPEFDHFFPKSDYPILALSFYNLIPSCNVCNTHFKGSKDPIKYNLFHPYSKVKSTHFSFKFFAQNYASLIGKDLSIKLGFDYNETAAINSKLKATISFFDIKAIYEKCHSDIIKDIIDKRIIYCDEYLLRLQSDYKMDFNEAYRILFETHYDEKDLHKRPFSKLKKDIYHDLEILKYVV